MKYTFYKIEISSVWVHQCPNLNWTLLNLNLGSVQSSGQPWTEPKVQFKVRQNCLWTELNWTFSSLLTSHSYISWPITCNSLADAHNGVRPGLFLLYPLAHLFFSLSKAQLYHLNVLFQVVASQLLHAVTGCQLIPSRACSCSRVLTEMGTSRQLIKLSLTWRLCGMRLI
jgi:hypothetical protein